MENQEPLQVGDVVRLKSGGPDMKVVSPEVKSVYVAYEGCGKGQESFPVTSLRKVGTV
jgi:uncharacterized protein YodC (DUF2158 family)